MIVNQSNFYIYNFRQHQEMSSIDQQLHQKVQKLIHSLKKQQSIYQPQPNNILNGLHQNKHFRKISIINFLFLLCLFAQHTILYCYIELDISRDDRAHVFLHFSLICCVLGSLILYILYDLLNDYYSLCHQEKHSKRQIILSLLVYNIMPFSFLENNSLQLYYQIDNIQLEVKVNYILTICATFRGIYFIKNFLLQSKYMDARTFRITDLYGHKLNKYFTLRSIFKDHPFYFVSILFVMSILAFSFSLRIAEEYPLRNSSSFTIYCNMIWMTIITMTSVGFGDFKCQTLIGRLLGTFCATWGILIVSLMVGVLTNILAMSQSTSIIIKDQSQSLRLLKRLQIKADARAIAGLFIREKLWRMWTNYKYKLNKKSKKTERVLRFKFLSIRKKDHKINKYETKLKIYNEMHQSFLNVLANVDRLKDNNLLFMNYFTQNLLFQKTQNSHREQCLREIDRLKI